MTSFNAGIEAAWRLVCSRAYGGTIDLYSVSEAVQALKRPEPSEVERVEKVARAIANAHLDGDWWYTLTPEGRGQWRDMARAALKAMEG